MTPWLVRRKDRFEMHRRVTAMGSNWVKVEQAFSGLAESAYLATGSSWLVSRVRVRQGALAFRTGRGQHRAPSNFMLYLPPGALVRMPVLTAEVSTVGFAGRSLPCGWPGSPLAIELPAMTREPTLDDFGLRLRSAGPEHGISADLGCPPRVVRARQALARAAPAPLPVRQVARLESWSPSVLSRAFSQWYALTARSYCQRLRVHDGVMALLAGASIAHAAFDAGFSDLSRFYRQFKATTGSTPGSYRRFACAVKNSQDADSASTQS